MAKVLPLLAEQPLTASLRDGLILPWNQALDTAGPGLSLVATALGNTAGQGGPTLAAALQPLVQGLGDPAEPAGAAAGPPPALVELGELFAAAINSRAAMLQAGVSPASAPVPAVAPAAPVVEATPAISAGWQCVTSASDSPRLWRYVLPGQEAAIDTGLETLVLTHGWLGSGVTSAPTSPLGFNAGLNAAAVNLASASRQVLFLDWGPQALDPNPSGLAPYSAAGRINAVAAWAKDPLQALASSGKTLTLVGFSLGSYVAAQTAVQLGSGSNLRLVALEPAAAGLQGAYDLDSSNGSADPVPNLAGTTPFGSLAFVVADTNLSIGLAGDNTRAGTAQRSFLVKGFTSSTSAADAHGAIPAFYADLARYLTPNAAVTQTLLAGFRANQYSNSGSLSGTRPHEGVVTLRNNQGALSRIEGFTASGSAQTIQFVDSGDSLTPAGSSSSQDTLVSLRTLQLGSSASIERLVLGGNGAIGATGNAGAQELIGNAAANRLEGKAGIDRISGGEGGDTFIYAALSDALVGGSSTLRSFESITDFDTSLDRIDAPGTAQRSVSNLGSVASLSDTGLRGLLTSGNFAAGAAALFRFTPSSGGGERLFLGLNDSSAGFDPLRDAIVELTGLRGDSLSLLVS